MMQRLLTYTFIQDIIALSFVYRKKRETTALFYTDVRSACVKRTRGVPARGHERTSFISGLEESVARFYRKKCGKKRRLGHAKKRIEQKRDRYGRRLRMHSSPNK